MGVIGRWLGPSGGGTGGNAAPAEVLANRRFTNDDGEQVGSMVDRGAYNITPSSVAQTIHAGYHNGSGLVAPIPSTYKQVTTGAINIASGGAATITLGYSPSIVYVLYATGSYIIAGSSSAGLYAAQNGGNIIAAGVMKLTITTTGFSINLSGIWTGPGTWLINYIAAS